jgi:hypothetical protein
MVEDSNGLDQVKNDPFYIHEALDRTHMVASILEDHLLQHPWVKINKSVSDKLDAALMLLAQAYQEIGQYSETKDESNI